MRCGYATLLLIILSACAHYPVNPPLTGNIDPNHGYRYANLKLPRIDDTFVVLAFSGGGSRAAGFSYGVLLEMQNTKMPGGRTMLDYIDVISSVSGGSFTAMQFGLRGPEGLGELKANFLDQNIQGMLFRAVFFNPRNWIRLLSPNFHRIDLAQEIYDRQLFKDADFAALLAAQRSGRPLIIANATELEIGARFEWTQDQFDPICSDLSSVHVSRAVAASSAFPGLLSPMVVNSYTSRCGYKVPPWVANARQDEDVNPERTRNAIELESYIDARRGFLHLMDGGIADNIGLRGPLHAVISSDTFVAPVPGDPSRTGFTILGELNRNVIKNLLFIVVTAEPDSREVAIDSKSRLPDIVQILGAVINTPMGNYSFDTIGLLRQTFQAAQIRQSGPAQCQDAVRRQNPNCTDAKIRGADQPQIGYYKTVVSFPLVRDERLRQRLNAIATSFELKPGQLDDLVTGARAVIDCSEEYRAFVEKLGGTANPCQ
ncbi:MAG: patatin-like phospholipase family protein [Thermoanaerobaculia bacterium]